MANARAFGGQEMRDAIPDALTRSADDGTLSRQVQIHIFKLFKEGLRVAVKNPLEYVVGIALGFPVTDQALIAEQRIIGTEHDAMLEPARDLMTQIGGMILRRPSMQARTRCCAVHQHGDRLGLPRPSRTARATILSSG